VTALDDLIPAPRLAEIDSIDVATPADRAWTAVRHGDLGRSPLVRTLFAMRELPARLRGRRPDPETLTIDRFASSPDPGFHLLAEREREVAVGAIGRVWQLEIPFVDVRSADAYARFDEPGYAKVAWSLRVIARGTHAARIEVEVRVTTTDDESWERFRRYFRIVGPGSHFIRHSLLTALGRELGRPRAEEHERRLPGDELLPDALDQITHGITIGASPEAIWPWLVQMGCRRAGWYSWDRLDNAGIESARAVDPDLQQIHVGDVLPATPEGEDGFEVLRVEPPRVLILGGLFDSDGGGQRPFAAARPEHYWHVTWAFVLEAIGASETRLLVRARAALSATGWLHALWIRPVHSFMQTAQLRNLKARVEAAPSR